MANARRLLYPLVILSLTVASPAASAVDVLTTLDRNKAQVGTPVTITVTVRQAQGRPLIHPPSVADCVLEQVGQMRVGQSAPPANKGKTGPTRTAPGNKQLTDAIEKLESQTQKMLADQARSGGGPGGAFTKEYQDLLRGYRQQALEALNGSAGLDYQVTYRLTAKRSGILTLPGFRVESGGKSYQGRPLELTIDEGASPPTSTGAKSPPAAPPAPLKDAPPVAAPTTEADSPSMLDSSSAWLRSSLSAHDWPLLLVVLCTPPMAYLAYVSLKSRRSLREQAAAARPVAVLPRPQLVLRAQPEEVAAMLSQYVRQRCHLPPGEVTPAEAEEGLLRAGVDRALARRCANLLDVCASARYAPGGDRLPPADLAKQAHALFKELHGAVLTRPSLVSAH